MGRWVPTNREGCFRYSGDLRLLIGTPKQIAKVKRQIKKRSQTAKAGWVKRRAALSTNTGVINKDKAE